ncbi:hypothetical protein QP968_10130 [Corynebacterium sp. MSK041]|uniref:hypothetical protein n=1 Tax=Corynebacterium sp. MSK041 TaxID=3050194 RepID=UPI00254FF67E|nr:hypothetical protein [Corynebacterium sp. MSK041]MDK8796063.1 hypothetical protein [Corynebacterium sp. MSK041]
MNLRTLGMAYKAASFLYGRYRDMNDEQQRDVYDAMRALARPASTNEKGEPFDAARLQAGALTRVAHDRLDARRAQFHKEQQEKEARKAAEKLAKKQRKKEKKGNIGRAVGVLGLLAGIAGAVWFFLFREDTPAAAPAKSAAPKAPAPMTTRDRLGADHGPLSEDPAERDEELLASIDEQLSSLDALADDQRESTQPRNNM